MPQVVSFRQLEVLFADGDTITKEALWTNNLIKRQDRAIKVIGSTKRFKNFIFADEIILTARLAKDLEQTKSAK